IADFERALGYMRQSFAVGRKLNEPEQMGFGLAHAANFLATLTRYDDALQTAEEGRELAVAIGNRERLAECLATISICNWRNGDLAAARVVAQEGHDVA